ncbi:MAG: CehA/McbA family metallohydrolase [Thermoplasmata archaeon]|jgi:predicted metal-dependent phosphoesterase TrpH
MTSEVRLDLHVHSRHSPDSQLTLDQIAGKVPYAGLRGFALTDHNTVAGHREIRGLTQRYPGLLVLPGVEISTLEGHMLAYGVHETPPIRRPIVETIEWVRAHGGESVLSHPFRRAHGVGAAVAETAPVRGIEVLNGHSSQVVNAKAELVAARRSLAETGGSDVHELYDLGRAFTDFPGGATSVDDLLEAIRKRAVVPGGQSLRWPRRVRLAVRTGTLLATRRFRRI